MSTVEENKENTPETEMWNDWEKNHRRGRMVGGLFVVVAGGLYLAHEMGVWMPEWLFTWQMLVIFIGLMMGVKHSFRNLGWLIPVLIGGAFLARDYMPHLHITSYIWPVVIIVIGLSMIFRPKRNPCRDHNRWHRYRNRSMRREMGKPEDWSQHSRDWRKYYDEDTKNYAPNDYLEFNAVFGSIKKNVITKSFKGGEVNAIFGGTEINLMQADFEGTVQLEINAIFGGARLIIPAHWEVKSEIAAIMGSVEDKRPPHKDVVTDSNKVLVIQGNSVFGGIEIQSF